MRAVNRRSAGIYPAPLEQSAARNMRCSKGAGFTLFEMVLAIGIIALLVALTTAGLVQFQTANDLGLAATSEVEALRRAQVLARAGEGDARWGVKLATGTIIVFRGTSFATRDSAYDETTEIASDISINGIDEFVFRELLATTTTTGTTTLYHTVLGESRAVHVNAKGTVNY